MTVRMLGAALNDGFSDGIALIDGIALCDGTLDGPSLGFIDILGPTLGIVLGLPL